MDINVGDSVIVKMYTGNKKGIVMEAIPNYGFIGKGQETKYRIAGKGFETVCSERLIINE